MSCDIKRRNQREFRLSSLTSRRRYVCANESSQELICENNSFVEAQSRRRSYYRKGQSNLYRCTYIAVIRSRQLSLRRVSSRFVVRERSACIGAASRVRKIRFHPGRGLIDMKESILSTHLAAAAREGAFHGIFPSQIADRASIRISAR